MKTMGLLGGMSWESTALYYRWINEMVRDRLGGLHSARIAMVRVDFQEIEELQHQNRCLTQRPFMPKKPWNGHWVDNSAGGA